jgi:NAD(P)-dependent dehydrogenase (short-subunit alcohol dehydrogenase family)
VNLSGPIQMVQAFLPQFKARPDALIVNVSKPIRRSPLIYRQDRPRASPMDAVKMDSGQQLLLLRPRGETCLN